jgi:hypothetical protein
LATISKQKYRYGNFTLIMDALFGIELAPFATNWKQQLQGLSCFLASKP